MRIAFAGCGYVFDIYMRTKWAYPEFEIRGVFDINAARARDVGSHYGLNVYDDYQQLLDDESVDIVVNLTSIDSHYEVTRRALEADKHVYSEKPLTTELEQTRELFDLAEQRGVVLGGAPSNVFSDAVSTLWKAVRDGAIGNPVLIYAELDDSPAHLMHLEEVQSPSGAPWPYVEEFQQGCTFEHAGYHLTWMCSIFGPVRSVTAYSKALIRNKTATPLSPADTPDYSVACLDFDNGVTARLTNSIVAPRDHRLRIIGDEGEICAPSYCQYQSPVRLERFSPVSLAARKMLKVREQPLLGRPFGVGGRSVPLVRHWKSYAVEAERGVRRSLKQRFVSWLRRREIYAEDKLLGIAEMARALQEGRPQLLPPDLLTHVNELTLLIQRAGTDGIATRPRTSFTPIEPRTEVANSPHDYRASYRPRLLEKMLGKMVGSLHRR